MHFLLHLHPQDEFISNYIRVHQCWEPLTTEVLHEVFTKVRSHGTHVFVDVGANIGYFTLLVASHRLMPVIAVEPVHENLQLLYQSIHDNHVQDVVTVFPCAVGSQAKVVPMNIDVFNFGCCSAKDIIANKTQWVQQRSLPDCLHDAGGVIGNRRIIMKVDVENQEFDVVETLSPSFWQLVDVLIIEISSRVMDTFDMLMPHFDKGMVLETSRTGVVLRSVAWSAPTTHLATALVSIAELRHQVEELKQHQVDLLVLKSSFLKEL